MTNAEGKTGYMAGANYNVIDIPTGQVGYKPVVAQVDATLNRDTSRFPETPEGEEAWAAFNTAGNLQESLASIYAQMGTGKKAIVLTLDPTAKVRITKVDPSSETPEENQALSVYKATPDDSVSFELALAPDGSTKQWANNNAWYSIVGTNSLEDDSTFTGSKIVASIADKA